jgi:hypothetical protein
MAENLDPSERTRWLRLLLTVTTLPREWHMNSQRGAGGGLPLCQQKQEYAD